MAISISTKRHKNRSIIFFLDYLHKSNIRLHTALWSQNLFPIYNVQNCLKPRVKILLLSVTLYSLIKTYNKFKDLLKIESAPLRNIFMFFKNYPLDRYWLLCKKSKKPLHNLLKLNKHQKNTNKQFQKSHLSMPKIMCDI